MSDAAYLANHPATHAVRALAGSSLEELRSEWRRRYGPPPLLRSTDLLARLLAWRIQAEAFGGLDAKTVAALARQGTSANDRELSAGTRLEREWRGRTEVVDAVEGGFRWRDETYPSLSKVAFAMTGTKWNGPRFFGLRSGESR